MSYTNATIPNRYSSISICNDKIKKLEFENKLLNEKLDAYEKEFYNIFEAIKDYGFIEFKDERGKLIMKLVEGKE